MLKWLYYFVELFGNDKYYITSILVLLLKIKNIFFAKMYYFICAILATGWIVQL